MAKRIHRTAPASENHVIQRWEVANTAARLAIAPGPADLGGVARQADDGSLWACTGYAPVTWHRVDPDPTEFSAPALAAQAAAEAAAAAAVGSTKVYASTGAAQSDGGLANGAYYSVPLSGANDSFIFYRKDSGAASTEMARYPSAASLLTTQRNIPSILGAQLRTAPGAVTTLRAKGREAFTVVRSTAGEVWANGARVSCSSNTARISDDPWGILIEQARTNYVANPTAPTNQTTGSLGTGVHFVNIEGTGQVVVTAGSATGTGFPLTVTGRTPGTFTITGAGTVILTYSGSVSFAQVANCPVATSRLTTTGAASADKVSVANPLAGKTGAWWIDVVAELGNQEWNSANYKYLWTLGNVPYSAANVACLVAVNDSVYLDVFDGSSAQKRITCSTVMNLQETRRHRFTAGADELGNLFIFVDGQLIQTYSTAGAGSGIIAVQPASLYLGSDATLATSYLNGYIRDLEVRGGEVDVSPAPQRPRCLMLSDSIYMQGGLRDAIRTACWPDIVPDFDVLTIGGDTIGTALSQVADKVYAWPALISAANGGSFQEVFREFPLSLYDALIFEFGRNETYLTGETWSVYQIAYDKLINQALKLGIKRVLAGNPPPICDAGFTAWQSDTYNTGGYRVAASDMWAKYGIRGIDNYSAFLDLTTRGVKSIADLMSDTGHANTAGGWADIARRISNALREKLRQPVRRTSGGNYVTAIQAGTVRTYIGGEIITGSWAMSGALDLALGINAKNHGCRMLPRISGLRDQAIVSTSAGARLNGALGKANQIWVHLLLQAGGGSVDTYVDRGTGGEVHRTFSTDGAGYQRVISVLAGEGLALGSDHRVEWQSATSAPVAIIGATYLGGD